VEFFKIFISELRRLASKMLYEFRDEGPSPGGGIQDFNALVDQRLAEVLARPPYGPPSGHPRSIDRRPHAEDLRAEFEGSGKTIPVAGLALSWASKDPEVCALLKSISPSSVCVR
jgi:hypothetical protein